MAVAYNLAESSLFFLFCQVSRLPGRLARILAHDLQSPAICQRINEITSIDGLSAPETKEFIQHATALFDANRTNRNQLTHFLPTLGTDGVELRRNKGPRLERDVIPSSLDDIRRVADDIRRMNGYLVELGSWLSKFNSGRSLDDDEDATTPLPEKPAIPERLWKPPAHPSSPNRKKRQRQPRSSQGWSRHRSWI